MTKEIFDPNAPANSENIFGLPHSYDDAKIIIIPVPWEVTVSFKTGTAIGPKKILDASYQVDLYDSDVKDAWKIGIHLDEFNEVLYKKNQSLRKKAKQYIDVLVSGKKLSKQHTEHLKEINKECLNVKNWLYKKSKKIISENKIPVSLGGDHSTPLGLIEAIAEEYKEFSILHIDAHFDLRKAYEGFTYSHASIMYNASKIKNLKNIVHVGIRDFCEEEITEVKENKKSIVFYDHYIKESLYEGKNWDVICDEIISKLSSQNIFISFDIDGLDPKLCPSTGTPVAGGLEFQQSIFLIKKMIAAKKKIISFDINEVASDTPDNFDGNVGARLLYKLCNLMSKSQGINP
jgi:agmatinase